MALNLLRDLAPLIIFIGIALVLVGAVAIAYIQSSKARNERIRRRASWIGAFASGVVALIATLGIAIPVLEDLHNPSLGFRSSLIVAVVEWSVCLYIWGIAVRCVFSALRKNPKG